MKLLRNRKTGVVFPFSERLLQNKNMEPYHGEDVENGSAAQPEPPAPPALTSINLADDEPPAQPSQDSTISISRASKAELIEHARQHYGKDLPDSMTVPELRQEVKSLIENEG